MTMKVTELDPPHSWHFHGIEGPVREVRGTTESLGNGERSRMTLDLDFEVHGLSKLLVPLVVLPRASARWFQETRRG
jgi:hypothetical protein